MLRTSDIGALPSGVVHLVMGRRIVREFANQQVSNPSTGLAALDTVLTSCAAIAREVPGSPAETALRALYSELEPILRGKRASKSGNSPWQFGVSGLNLEECRGLTERFNAALEVLGAPEMNGDISSVDTPIPFDAADLVDLLGVIANNSGSDAAGWVAPMQDRLAVAMSDQRLVSACGHEPEETLESWITDLLGPPEQGQITVLDLSLVPAQAQQVIASVLARLLLETLERHRRLGRAVPVILAVEEAHSLIRRRSEGGVADGLANMTELCRESFERIGREGRKFGLSLVVSSQRPSELSETVLSQCNSYLIHRIVNHRDQDFVRRLVPDNLGLLMDEIASYPARTALLVGAAAQVPVLIEVADLDARYRPDSADPDFEGAWSSGAPFDAAEVAGAWTPASQLSTPRAENFESHELVGSDEPPF